jgi:endonuclease III
LVQIVGKCGPSSMPSFERFSLKTRIIRTLRGPNILWIKKIGVGDYDAVRAAPLLEDVLDALRCGGLANIKGGRIQRLLDEVYNKYENLALDHLHGAGDEEAKRELMGFDGVGPKTASCVLLFYLRRDSFAVDTHVVNRLQSRS